MSTIKLMNASLVQITCLTLVQLKNMLKSIRLPSLISSSCDYPDLMTDLSHHFVSVKWKFSILQILVINNSQLKGILKILYILYFILYNFILYTLWLSTV